MCFSMTWLDQLTSLIEILSDVFVRSLMNIWSHSNRPCSSFEYPLRTRTHSPWMDTH